jgi:hypothetical protein
LATGIFLNRVAASASERTAFYPLALAATSAFPAAEEFYANI